MHEVEVRDVDAGPFELDVRVVVDVGPGDAAGPCDSADGCGQTCPSSCVSR